MTYRLKFTNPWNEVHWFCNLGGNWPASNNRLIERTCTRQEDARTFDTIEAAKEVLTITANPIAVPDAHGIVQGWQVVDENGVAVKPHA